MSEHAETAQEIADHIKSLEKERTELAGSALAYQAQLLKERTLEAVKLLAQKLDQANNRINAIESELESAKKIEVLMRANEAEQESESLLPQIADAQAARDQVRASFEQVKKLLEQADRSYQELVTRQVKADQRVVTYRKAWHRMEFGPAPIDRTPAQKATQRAKMDWMQLHQTEVN